MIVGIVGSRRRTSQADQLIVVNIIDNLYSQFGDDLVIVSGGCKTGADNIARNYCESINLPILEFPATLTGPKVPLSVMTKAYHSRNRSIAELSTRLYALVADDRTGGTENTIAHAHELGKSVWLVGPTGHVAQDARPLHDSQSRLNVRPTGASRVVSDSPFDKPYGRD